ncbi:MAG TPA: GDSL-type esterase/lipase family protein [Polyangiaceae bacterium]|nr:GDSL-type esterase/lipase family protein [Polyangiaceae bacterium]
MREFSVGAQADWLVTAPDVAAVHLRLAFDGRELRAASADPRSPVYLGVERLDARWQRVSPPAVLRFGQAELTVSAGDVAAADARPNVRLPSYFVDMVAAKGRAPAELAASATTQKRADVPVWVWIAALCLPLAVGIGGWLLLARGRSSASTARGASSSASASASASAMATRATPAPLAPSSLSASPAPLVLPVEPAASGAAASDALAPSPDAARHAYPQNVADKPVPRIGAHPWEIADDWRQHHERLLEAKGRADAKVVFLGDSITEAWRLAPAYQTSFGRYAPLDLGIAGDLTQNLLWRIDQGELDGTKPGVAVVMIGVNNLAGGFTAEQTASGVQAVVAAVRAHLPQALVLLLEILPAHHDPADPLRTKIVDCNRLIEAFADPAHVLVRDFGPLMLEADGTIAKETMRDFLHPTPAGYERLSLAVAPLLVPVLGDGATPAAAP